MVHSSTQPSSVDTRRSPKTLSAVMPNFNHAKYLPDAIESILQQTRPPDEFLILDDASTDNSVEIIESYAARYPLIRFVRNSTNEGVIAAHEKLFRMAAGEWLYSGAADDDRYPRFFELAMEMAERYPDAGLVFGKMVTTDSQGRELGEIASKHWQSPLYADPNRYLHEYLDVESPFHSATAATIFRREAFAEVGWFHPELGSVSDTFAVRAIAMRYGACYVPERFCSWRKVHGSVSQQYRQNAQRTLEVVDRAAAMMRSDTFRDRFPAKYIARWERSARRQVLWSYLLGDEHEGDLKRPNFLIRNLARLKRVPALVALMARRVGGR